MIGGKRTLRNLPARLLALLLAVALVFPAPALAADPPGGSPSPDLPPGISPEQAELVRKLLQTEPEARKALEDAQRRKEKEAQRGTRAAGEAEADAARKEQAVRPEAAAAAAPAEPGSALRYDWRKSPYVGNLFAKRITDNEAASLPHFGHELFTPSPGAAQSLENIPVSGGYIVGPGDEIVVKMWGRVEGTQRMVVDRDGKIFFPKFGSLYVAGKTFEEMKSFLKAKVSTIAEVSSDVAMGQLRGIRVSVVGEVRTPGWYNVSSLHTALQVLSAAGGMKDIGSMRSVKINRGGRTVDEIDLYEFLLKGEARGDLRMLQDDVIFVPVVGTLVAVVGEVRRPAIYELKREKTLLDVIRLAGGFAPAAWKRQVQVERLEGNTARIVLDTDADQLERGQTAFALADGDVVRVFPIVLADENVVTLEGNVRRPGKYELKPGMTVGGLLKDEKDFLQETYFDYALLIRRVPPDLHKEIVPVNLREIVLERKPGADVALAPRDTLKVFPRNAFRDLPKAYISGEVRLTRKLQQRLLTVDNQVITAPIAPETGGTEPKGVGSRGTDFRGSLDLRGADLRRTGSLGNDLRIPDPRGADLQGAADPRGWDFGHQDARGADSRGADAPPLVHRPDQEILAFEIHAGTRVADLVKMAGGLTRLAYLERAEIVRVDDDRNFRTIYFHLGKALEGDPAENLLLENEDQVRIHSIWETKYRKSVTVTGEVNIPGDYVLTDGMKLSDLLFKAGGFREGAFTKEAELVRREITPQGDLVKTQTVVVYPENAIARMPETDLPLRAYDVLFVRQIPEWAEKIHVTLSGEFRFPGTYAVGKSERLSSVIRRAGGYTPDAYLKAAVFTRVSTQKTQQQAIDRFIEELEVAIAEKGQELGAVDREDLESNKQLMETRRLLLAQLKKARAKGRVIIQLGDPAMAKGKGEEIFLEDGDQLNVPPKTNVVNVVGRVYNPTGVVYDPANDTVGYYLETVGGPMPNADTDHIFLLKANGSVLSRDNAPGGIFSGGFMSAKAEPGDSVVVPEKLLQVRLMKDVKDITQILMQIAVTAGVLIALF